MSRITIYVNCGVFQIRSRKTYLFMRLQQTSILSNPALRKRHEFVERALMPFRADGITIKDLAADEAAKEDWKRIRNGNMELPCILVDGHRVGVSVSRPQVS